MSTIRYTQTNIQFLPNILQHVYVDVGIDFENFDTAVSMAEDMSEEVALSELEREEGRKLYSAMNGLSLAGRIDSFNAVSNEMIMDVRN
ncbi:hypothetical protein CEXT_641191 [Caerostris extrusa]|uniref:Uncharacterized protein n=1 Tax=Caerostris extrusa TaxID=172846 RepID=A0AAV4N6A4_CAEEX|nr:hypothetical protein CEXT_641191 [Caerostris extrusa]